MQKIQLCSSKKYLDLIRSNKIHLDYQQVNPIVSKKKTERRESWGGETPEAALVVFFTILVWTWPLVHIFLQTWHLPPLVLMQD